MGGDHVIKCALCPATYTISSDLIDAQQAQFFAELNCWRCRFESDVHWCPKCFLPRRQPLLHPAPKTRVRVKDPAEAAAERARQRRRLVGGR